MNTTRKIIAIIVSPLITAFIFTMLLLEAMDSDGTWFGSMLLIVAIPVFYTGAILFGYPSISYLMKKQKLTILWLSVSAFIIGFVVINLGLIVFYITSIWDPQTVQIINRVSFSETLLTVLIAGISCTSGAFIFSLISGITQRNNISLSTHTKPNTKDNKD